MALFGNELQAAIAEMGWNQRTMTEKAAAFSQSQLSRYLSGKNLPEPYTLEALCAVFPEQLRERLTIAYLLDQIPLSARHLVEVRPTGARSGEDVPQFGKAPKGSKLHRYLASLERIALSNRDMEKAIMYMVRSYEGLPLHDDDEDDEVIVPVSPKKQGKPGSEKPSAQS